MPNNPAIFFIVTAEASVNFPAICNDRNVFHTASAAKSEARIRADSPNTHRTSYFVHKIAVSDDGCNIRVDTVSTK